MKFKINDRREFAYMLAVGFLIFFKVYSNTLLSSVFPGFIYKLLPILSILMCITSVVFRRIMTKKRFCFFVLFVFFGLVIYYKTKEIEMLALCFLLGAAVDVNLEKLLKEYIGIVGSTVLVTFAMCFFGIIADYQYSRAYIEGFSFGIAHSYGFVYYSHPSWYICYLSLAVLYFSRKISTIILVVLINIWAYITFTTRLPFYLFLLFIVIWYVINYMMKKRKDITINYKVALSIPLILACICIILFYNYDGSTPYQYINFLFNGRLGMGYRALREYGPSLFGQYVEMVGTFKVSQGIASEYFFIDSDYLYMIVCYGLAFSFYMLYIYGKLLQKIFSIRDSYLFTYILFALIFAFGNTSLTNISLCPFVLYGASVINEKYTMSKIMQIKHEKVEGR